MTEEQTKKKIESRQEFLDLAREFLMYEKSKNDFDDSQVMHLSIFAHGIAKIFDDIQEERIKAAQNSAQQTHECH